MKYNFNKIEKKWQREWERQKLYQAEDFSKKPKKYIMVEFPYPSGDGLHVGHVRSYTALDALARKKRMEGFNVLYPMGWDAFGLPTENYAIKTGVHPAKVTENNIKVFKKQMNSLGLSFDWSREINTTDPKYYKWSQWIFLQFFKKDLAYQAEMPINWCPSCKIGLANEEVISGKCERCGAQTEKKLIKQWLLKITKYADRLIDDLDKVNYVEKIKTQQINWIGRSEGLEEDWQVEGMDLKLKTFTTWPHTTWGTTFMVIAPEHPIIEKLVKGTKYEKGAREFCKKVIQEKIKDPMNIEKSKDGFFTGRYVINHLNGRRVPLYIASFAIYDYGSGIVKCTPAHDQRDFEFAKKYNLDFIPIVKPANGKPKAIAEYTIKQGHGRQTVQYKLRDWIFSRQHYWGEPIPIIHCSKCGTVAVPEKDLPVELPYVEKYQPSQTGESPLAKIKEWVEIKCPKCQSPAKRETDTMPNWAGSSWYFLRYIDPHNAQKLADFKKLKYWLPVDLYNGGMEHTTLHLLYSRFWHKFLYDLKVVPTAEPYYRRQSHGVVLAEDGRKMSKSFNNVIKPDDVIKQYGADTLRIYEMFMGPFDQMINWSTKGVQGCWRFLNRVWQLFNDEKKFGPKTDKELLAKLHQLIKKVGDDLEAMKFNTAVAAFMKFVNAWTETQRTLTKKQAEIFLRLLAPLAPHISEELWNNLGHKKSIFLEKWPTYAQKLIEQETFQLIIQINGKVRDKIEVKKGISEKEVKELTLSQEKVQKWLGNKKPKKVIYIPNRLVNLVV